MNSHRISRLRLPLLALVTLALTSAGCAAATVESGQVTGVDADRAESLIDGESDLVVLDIRTPEETATGTLPGAIEVDFYSPDFQADLAELDRDTPYLVYCRSGNRSGQAVEVMQDLGFSEVYELSNGIGAWVGAGKPLMGG